MKKTISIIVPAYNENEVLTKLYVRLNKLANSQTNYNFEILFVNDGSKDRTLKIIKEISAKDPRVSYINLSRNFGKEIAMIAGLDYAKGDAVVIIDADLQDPPELIPEMIKQWEAGYDDVYAKRRSREGETKVKRYTSKLYYAILQKATKIEIQKDTGDFRLLDRRCVTALKELRETHRNTKGIFSWIGFNKKEIMYDRDPRAAGEGKWSYWRLADLAIEGIISFTTAPLRWASFLGVLVSGVAFLYILVIVFQTIFNGARVGGYPSTMAVMLFLGGVQLLFLGIIGEYVGRIFNETKNRPLYFIEQYHLSQELTQKRK